MILERITIMKTRIFIIAIVSFVTIVANGQTFQPAAVDNNAIQSHQIMQTGKAYNGTVYEPFSSATPSEYSKVGGESSEGNNSGRHIRTFINPSDPGNQSNEYPIGDAVLPLLALALVYSVWSMVYRRRKMSE